MVIKQNPDDFQVEELTAVQAGDTGSYGFYRLSKTGWTTPDALASVRRRWQIDFRRLSYGGLKDRHAQTIQYFTIHHGPRRNLAYHGIDVVHLGQIDRPYSSEDIGANRFRIVVRKLTNEAILAAMQALDEVRSSGVPNYFDDQRFGSVGPDGAFLARHLLQGNFDEALRSALTAPYEFDRPPQKKEKALLRKHWGDWLALKDQLPRGHARSLICFLADHPTDLRGAVARLRPELRGLYLSAYQSYLWNRMLAAWLRAHVPADRLVDVKLKLGAAPMPRGLAEEQLQELGKLRLPLHSARIRLEDADPCKPYFDQTLAEDGVTLDQFKLKGLREMFFSKGDRALCMPEQLHAEPGDDENHPGKKKLTLSFDLPRGSYATLIVKRLQQARGIPAT